MSESDIVERLRNGEPCAEEGGNACKVRNAISGCLCATAADTITALRAEVEKMEGALSKISEYEIEEGCPCNACQHSAIARAALGDTHE